MRPVLLPILDANMTHGTVRAWLKQEGEVVRAGEPLFEVETDKVNAEVEAQAAGTLRRIVAPVGSRVAVLGLVAFIGEADEALPEEEMWGTFAAVGPQSGPHPLPLPEGVGVLTEARTLDATPAKSPLSPEAERARVRGSDRPTASPAARRLARERGVALDQIRGTGPRGEITRADIEAAAGVGTGAAAAQAAGDLDPAFVALLKRDTTAFRALSSDAKIDLYRRHGAQIGEHVRLESGALIIAPHIRIGDASTIGADTLIECDRLHLGRLVAFGQRTRVRCRSVEIGDALWSKDDVVIGGGGSDEPGAHLRAGDACFFGEGSYLNTCHPITLGNEVCIGSRAMLFTHSHWQSVLHGYPSLFAPIEVGDHVFIGNNAFVFPGVRIGAGATVVVNSFVAVHVAPNTLVGGVPAQVMRHITPPTRDEQIALVRDRLLPELAAALRAQGWTANLRALGADRQIDLGTRGTICFTPEWSGSAAAPDPVRTVVLTFAPRPVSAVDPLVTVCDLAGAQIVGAQDAVTDEVREFCRRRGIRFRPLGWRHGVGHVEGNRFVPRRRQR